MSNNSDSEVIEIQHRYPLKKYLELVSLPSFKRPSPYLPFPIGRARRWPTYVELVRLPETRALRQVTRIDSWEFSASTRNYFSQLSEVFIENEAMEEEEDSARLRLPSSAFMHYDENDLEFLSHIDNEDDFTKLVQDYILDTVSEVLRLIENLPLNTPLTKSLQFRRSSELCTAHHARWDISSLPTDAFNNVPIAIIFVPPWLFGTKDFHDFIAPQTFENAALDTLNTKSDTASDKLWAVVYDACRGRGHKFVLTNYLRWAFGSFNDDWSTAQITEDLEAPILRFDRTSTAVPWIGCNVVEFLTYWVQISRGAASF